MRLKKMHLIIPLLSLILSCDKHNNDWTIIVYETSESGNKLTEIKTLAPEKGAIPIKILPEQKYQEIYGFGGSFTEASAYLLNQLSKENRQLILEAYFGSLGANYSLTRTHINSCDFSRSNYSYAPVEYDKELKHFSIKEDQGDIIPMIKDAMEISKDGFKIISSPWTAPPWMKDNNDWRGGKLLPEYYDTWALFFSKYLKAYHAEGIDIWGITVENEPLGNNHNWESMHYTAKEMADFIAKHLGPRLEKENQEVVLLAYDQNRDRELIEWAEVIYSDPVASKYTDGFALHWYASTYDWFSESLQHTHNLAPGKLLIQTEACVDAEVPKWKDDKWYWSKEATDWGWDWAPEEQKHLHPKYVPVFRYARDIIGCMNNWVNGWIDWNMVLNKQGGPNWAGNWCIAPVIIDPESDEVYFTPLYFVLAHFSKYIRPEATRIGFKNPDPSLMLTAAENSDGSVAVVILNTGEEAKSIKLSLNKQAFGIQIRKQAIQTILLTENK